MQCGSKERRYGRRLAQSCSAEVGSGAQRAAHGRPEQTLAGRWPAPAPRSDLMGHALLLVGRALSLPMDQ